MNYKYKRGQIFGKRLDVPKTIMNQIYSNYLSFKDYIKYDLVDKIPISCLQEEDRKLVEKFGIEKVKQLDWDLLESYIIDKYQTKQELLMLDSNIENINDELYNLTKEQVSPSDFTPMMKERFPDRYFEILESDDEYTKRIKENFNIGYLRLNEILDNWELLKDKDLDYVLKKTKVGINQNDLKNFANNYLELSKLIIRSYKLNLESEIKKFQSLKEEEKKQYLDELSNSILEESKDSYYMYITDDGYKELFKYTSLIDYLKEGAYSPEFYDEVFEELGDEAIDYILKSDIPIPVLKEYNVIYFLKIFGIKNVVEFDKECGHFFTKNDCEMLKLMFDMYVHYAGNEHDPNKTIYVNKDEHFTKDEFYEAMRRMIINGPSDWNYANKAPNYSEMTGEFRTRNSTLFISDDAPSELKEAFYTKKITPQLLKEHRDYIPYIKGKDFESCFSSRSVEVSEVGHSQYGRYRNLYSFLNNQLGFDEFINFITEYSEVLDKLYDRSISSYAGYEKIVLSSNSDKEDILNKINQAFKDILIKNGISYSENIPQNFIENNHDLFLSSDAPDELKENFYNRKMSIELILSHPEYLEYLKSINLEMIFKYMPLQNNYHGTSTLVGLAKELFKDDTLDFMLLYGKYIEKLYDLNGLNRMSTTNFDSKDHFVDFLDSELLKAINKGNMIYDESVPTHFKNNNPTLFLPENTPDNIKELFYKKQLNYVKLTQEPELLNYFKSTNIIYGFSSNLIWLTEVFTDSDNIEVNNLNSLKIMANYEKINDGVLQDKFKDYIISNKDNLDFEKINIVTELFMKLSLSNSQELYSFRALLADQLINLEDPITAIDEIEKIFVKNNIPTIGKTYAAFEILHPDFDGFNFEENSKVSPVLKRSSTTGKKFIVFSDLIKAALGSNNRSINDYLENIEIGNKIYQGIKKGTIKFEDLKDEELKEMEAFTNHLITMYQRSMKGRMESKSIKKSDNIIEIIDSIAQILSPDGSLDYNLGDRIVNMFCGFSGIETLEEAKQYVKQKIESSDKRNRQRAQQGDFSLETGDLIKGLGGIQYIGHILQNGSVSKEYLGPSAASDATPLDTDVSIITKEEGSIEERIKGTAAAAYGPIWIALKNDGRFYTTRTNEEEIQNKRDLSKYELFYTGVCGLGHYGIRTGFPSSEIDYFIVDKLDSRLTVEIAMNGFYIPIIDKTGKLLFSPQDYDKLREKMSGLSHFNEDNYKFSNNLVTEGTLQMAAMIDQSEKDVSIKREKINSLIEGALNSIGISLKTRIDGDLTPGSVELIDTGSTGRGTNKPGDGDFDFMMRLDRDILSDPIKLQKLKETLLTSFGKNGTHEITGEGDFRLKQVNVGDGILVDIDISFTEKTDKITYSTDMCLQDRLQTIKTQDKDRYNLVVANILLAKKVLKEAGVYKPNRGEVPQGGLGGVGIENWILQNGGSFIDAARSFIEAAEGKTFEQFKDTYKIWDFGENHLAEKRGKYVHDNFVTGNMSEQGYNKMNAALKEYLLNLSKSQAEQFDEQKISK